MTPLPFTPIEIVRGDKKTFGGPLSVDKALAGSTITFQARRLTTDTSPLISKTNGDGSIVITSDTPGNRAIALTLVGSDTDPAIDVRGEDLEYAIRVRYSDGDGFYTVAHGTLFVLKETNR